MSKKEIEEFNLKLLRELDPDWIKNLLKLKSNSEKNGKRWTEEKIEKSTSGKPNTAK